MTFLAFSGFVSRIRMNPSASISESTRITKARYVALKNPKIYGIGDNKTASTKKVIPTMLAGLIFNGLNGHITTVEINESYYRQMHLALKEKVVAMGGAGMVTFMYCDDLKVKVTRKVDLVFIDTSHTYEHTLAELQKFSAFTNLIVCHDTKLEGVQKAINTFLKSHPEWKNIEVGATPYGLGILSKTKPL